MQPRHRHGQATAACGGSDILRRRDSVQGFARGAGAMVFPAALAGADQPPFTLAIHGADQPPFTLAIHASMFGRYRPPELYRRLRETGELLTYVHVADTFRTERIMDRFGVGLHLHLQPGLGEVNFREIFDSIEKIGYRGYVSLQAISHNDHPVESARESRRYLKDLLGDRLGV